MPTSSPFMRIVGEFRFEIPEQLRSKVIRPGNLKEVMDCVMDKKLLEAE